MSEPSLAGQLDQLYAADPAEFLARRRQLQGELRDAGLKPEAALLGRARRPSTAMWAVNQMVRRRRELVDALLDRSEQLRSAQSRGDRDGMREGLRAHRAAIAEAADAALDVLGARANETFREEVLSVLRAASTQPELGEQLRAGRLVRSDDLVPAFPEFEVAAQASEPAPADAAARAAERENRLRLDKAQTADAAANDAVAAAQQRVDELGEQLANAREELRDARSRARAAKAEVGRLAKLVERGSAAAR
jgi:hypothetical protein